MLMVVVPFEYERFHSRSFILQHLLTYNDGLENRIKQKKKKKNETNKRKKRVHFMSKCSWLRHFFFILSRFQQQMLHVIHRRV